MATGGANVDVTNTTTITSTVTITGILTAIFPVTNLVSTICTIIAGACMPLHTMDHMTGTDARGEGRSAAAAAAQATPAMGIITGRGIAGDMGTVTSIGTNTRGS